MYMLATTSKFRLPAFISAVLAIFMMLGVVPATAAVAATASIQGKVTVPAGVNIAGTFVRAYPEAMQGQTSESVSVAADGSYKFTGLSAGSYRLQFDGQSGGALDQWHSNATSYQTATPVTVAAGQTLTGLNATLVKGATISGKVTIPAGVNRSNVYVAAIPADSLWQMADQRVIVALDGSYKITGLKAGSYKIQFDGRSGGALEQWHKNAPSFATATAVTVTAGQDLTAISATLVKGATISGKVTAPAGVVLSNVYVTASAAGSQWQTGGQSSVAPDGSYKITGLPAGSFKIQFSAMNSGALTQWHSNAASFDAATALSVTAGQDLTGINATMVKGATISGKVTFPAGSVPYVYAKAVSTGSQYQSGQSFLVGPDGSYKITGLTAGSYKVQFSGSDGAVLEQWYKNAASFDTAAAVAVAAGQDLTGVSVTMVKAASISGKVTAPAGVTLSRVSVNSMSTTAQSQVQQSAVVAPDGSYRIAGLQAGSYKLGFSGWNTGAQEQWYPNATSPDKATVLTLATSQQLTGINATLVKGATISGKVTAPAGTNLATVFVSAASAASQGQPAQTASVAPDGTYKITGLFAGSYKLQFSGSNDGALAQWYANAASFDTAKAATVSTGQDLTGINVTLVKGATISGKVTAPAGVDVARIYVSVWSASVLAQMGQPASLAADGSYKVVGLPAGSYRLQFSGWASGAVEQWHLNATSPYQATAVTVTAGQDLTGVNATLIKGATISGKVTVPAGVNPSNILVSATPAASQDQGSRYNDAVSPDGSYTIIGLPAGPYKLSFRGGMSGTLEQWYNGGSSFATATPVTVAAGQDLAGINATVIKGATISGKVTAPIGVELRKTVLYGATVAATEVQVYPAGSSTTQIARADVAADGTSFDTARALTVTAGQALTGINPALVAGSTISGKVTGGGANTPVSVLNASGTVLKNGYAGADGTYSVSGLAAGSYKVAFNRASGQSVAEAQFYNNKPESAGVGVAQTLAVGASQKVANINAALVTGGTVTGLLKDKTGKPLAQSQVHAYSRDGRLITRSGSTDSSGRFSVAGLSTGNYYLVAESGADGTKVYSGNVAAEASATPIAASAGNTTDVGVLSFAPQPLTAVPVPTVTGSTVSGQKLTAVPGAWGPAPVTLAYQWKRSGVSILGATAATYTLTSSDVGKTITVTVTGSRTGYATAAKTSAATKAVTAG
jgi:hypothetical protein